MYQIFYVDILTPRATTRVCLCSRETCRITATPPRAQRGAKGRKGEIIRHLVAGLNGNCGTKMATDEEDFGVSSVERLHGLHGLRIWGGTTTQDAREDECCARSSLVLDLGSWVLLSCVSSSQWSQLVRHSPEGGAWVPSVVHFTRSCPQVQPANQPQSSIREIREIL